MKSDFIIECLTEFVTEERLSKFYDILNHRTRYITVVLEDIYQSHNASAVLRSCDCFGIQDVHIIENRNTYTVNPDIALGATKWLSLNKYNQHKDNTLDAIQNLKKNNYRIIATTPHDNDVSLPDLNLDQGKIALVFGSEMPGISDIVKDNADEFMKIPMYGFTESFNISVSVAICLYELSQRIRKSNIKWTLDEYEKNDILADWLKMSVKNSDAILQRKMQTNNLSG